MKKRLWIKIKGVIGIVLIFLAIGGVVYWEKHGRSRLLYIPVIVAKQDIPKNLVISKVNMESYLTYKDVEKSVLIDDYIRSIEDMVGLESMINIPRNACISRRYFGKEKLVLDKNQFVFKIPKKWIYDLPSTLRRKDEIDVYAVKEDKVDRLNKPLIHSVVAYVKDSSNREVVSIGEDERLDASAKIDSIEIIAKVDEINSLKNSFGRGYKFIILYR